MKGKRRGSLGWTGWGAEGSVVEERDEDGMQEEGYKRRGRGVGVGMRGKNVG